MSLNYLRTISVRDGVPLKYVCHLNKASDPTPNRYLLDNYVCMAANNDKAFTINTAYVHTFIVKFISGNETNEAKIKAY